MLKGKLRLKKHSVFNQLWLICLLFKVVQKTSDLPGALEWSGQVRSPEVLVCYLHGKFISGQGLIKENSC